MNDHPFDPSKPDQASHAQNGRHLPEFVPQEREPSQTDWAPERNSPLSPQERDRQEPELTQRRREDVAATRKDLKRLYLFLLAVGISLGALVSVGVVFLLDRFDLIDPTTEIQEPVE
jgi:hypothetical protein